MVKSDTHTVEITSLDKDGDGVAFIEGEKVKVPYSLPGESCEVILPKKHKGRGVKLASLHSVKVESKDRVKPVCKHFTQCGGCHLQHMSDAAYKRFKQKIVVDELERIGVEGSVVQDFFVTPLSSRRRVTFKVETNNIGYYAYRSRRFVPITECVILVDELQSLLQPLYQLLDSLAVGSSITEIQLFAGYSGVGVLLCVQEDFDLQDIELLTKWSDDHGLVSLCYKNNKEIIPITERGALELRCGEIINRVSIDSFQQASQYAQDIIAGIIRKELESADTVLDLYAGSGTHGLALGVKKRIHAVEGSARMVDAIKSTISLYSLQSFFTVEMRDLWLSPMDEKEISRFDAVILNPPKNGAESQIRLIADSSVSKTIMVSCNVYSFTRDLARLLYSCNNHKCIFIIDQFKYSNNIEIVGIFS